MAEIIKPVANIPLTAPSLPGVLAELKGCMFNPPVTLNRDELYLIVVTPAMAYRTIPGFYDVPDKGFVTFCRDFILVAASQVGRGRTRAFVFQAIEGEPPHDWVPDKGFDYRRYRVEQVIARQQGLNS